MCQGLELQGQGQGLGLQGQGQCQGLDLQGQGLTLRVIIFEDLFIY